MSLFQVDEEKCKKDGICAAECPLSIIDFQDKKQVPKPYDHSESMCINCGHCVAACPHGALSHKNIALEDCLEVDKNFKFDVEQTEHFLRGRRSIRNYKDKAVEKEKIEKLIQIASHAPSGHNVQPVQWQVINGKERVSEFSALVIDWMKHMLKEQPDLAKMMSLDMICAAWDMGMDVVSRNAPVLVLTNGGAKDPFADTACKIAMTFFDLAVPSQGLGSCWNGYFNRAVISWKPLQDALGFKEGFTNYGAMMLGYSKYPYFRMPTRNTPKVTWTD
jgi:nitroreductase/NAD-dependent dihydropyrimidine dehydrogenase PreA subunit